MWKRDKAGTSIQGPLLPVFWALVFATALFATSQPKEKSTLTSSVAKQMAALNYPELPKEVVERIRKPTKSLSPQTNAPLSQEWGLASIGFFDVFSRFAQPLNASTNPCSKEIVVAVIDTGVDYTHPALRENLWVNRGETGAWEPSEEQVQKGFAWNCRDKSCNGMDDDKNGFIDDVVGWDFVHDVPLPFDTHGHGTHISGIVGASATPSIGNAGVCSQISLMSLKYYDNGGAGYNNLANTVRAIEYAVANGAQIINYSGGGADQAASERLAVSEAQRKGVLFVAAAGNDGRNNDRRPYFPASYPLDNIISVASMNKYERLLPSSNFGRSVHVAAPGLMISSTLPGNRYGTMSGTSQATAFVTGAAALVASQSASSKFDYRQVKQWILSGAKPMKLNGTKTLLAAGLLSLPGSLASQKSAVVAVKPQGKSSSASEVAAAPPSELRLQAR